MTGHSGLTDEVLQQLRLGNSHAFTDEFARHRPRLKKMLQIRLDHRLKRRVDDSDILQDVYVDALNRIEHYLQHSDYSFFVWLRQLTEQRMIDVHRRHLLADMRSLKQEQALHVRGATSLSLSRHIVAHLTSPSARLMGEELMMRIEEGLRTLDDMDREVLALRHFEELRNHEVAQVLGIGEAAASNRYVRALIRLRKILTENGVCDD